MSIHPIEQARSLLLEPHGLNEGHLAKALAEIFTHQADYADLYFQYTRHESWGLEEGMVKSGSFSISQGVGVRAVTGDKTAFAYSDDLSPKALMKAASTVKTIARQGEGKAKLSKTFPEPHQLYAPIDPTGSVDTLEKVALLEKVEQLARSKDPAIVQVMAGLSAEYDVVMIAASDGRLQADIRPLVRLSLTVIAERQGRREMGHSGGGGRYGLNYFTESLLQEYVDIAVSEAIVNLEAKPAPAGEMTVVLGAGWPGILLPHLVLALEYADTP